MYRVYTQSLNGREKHRSQDDNGWACIHNHTENQEDDCQYGKYNDTGVEVAEDKVLNNLCCLCKGQYTAEGSCKRKYESEAAVCFYRLTEERNQFVYLDRFVNEQGNDDCIKDGKCCRLGRCNEACVDTAKNDYRTQKSPEAV